MFLIYEKKNNIFPSSKLKTIALFYRYNDDESTKYKYHKKLLLFFNNSLYFINPVLFVTMTVFLK